MEVNGYEPPTLFQNTLFYVYQQKETLTGLE